MVIVEGTLEAMSGDKAVTNSLRLDGIRWDEIKDLARVQNQKALNTTGWDRSRQACSNFKSVMPRDERGRWVRLPRTPARHIQARNHPTSANKKAPGCSGRGFLLPFCPPKRRDSCRPYTVNTSAMASASSSRMSGITWEYRPRVLPV